MTEMLLSMVVVLILAGAILFSSVKNVPPHERGVIQRLGKAVPGTVGPGIVIMLPFVDRMVRVSVVPETIEIGRATVVYRVSDPVRATTEVADYKTELITLARRLVEESANLDSAAMAKQVRSQLEDAARPWGIQIQAVSPTRFAKA